MVVGCSISTSPASGDDVRALRLRILIIAGLFYAWLLNRFDFNPFGPDDFGLGSGPFTRLDAV